MYKLLGEAVDTALALKPLVANANHCDVVIAPVFTELKTVADRLDGSNIRVAGQDCAVQNEFGAHTGEIAPVMLKDAGCSHVIIGHSERRQFYGETDQTVNRKTIAALAASLTAIVCVGEQLAEREAGNAETVVKTQLLGGLQGLTVSDLERIIILTSLSGRSERVKPRRLNRLKKCTASSAASSLKRTERKLPTT